MSKSLIKKGDEVVVLTGTSRGKRGKVIEVQRSKDRVLIEGINLIKRHLRKSQQHPEGAIVEREAAIHLSKVMRADRYDERRARKQPSA